MGIQIEKSVWHLRKTTPPPHPKRDFDFQSHLGLDRGGRSTGRGAAVPNSVGSSLTEVVDLPVYSGPGHLRPSGILCGR